MVVPPGNRRGSELRRTCSVRRKGRDPRTPGRMAISAVAAGGSWIMRAKTPPERPDLALHYQWRDYAPLQSRPPCYKPSDRGCPSAQLRVPSLSPRCQSASQGEWLAPLCRSRALHRAKRREASRRASSGLETLPSHWRSLTARKSRPTSGPGERCNSSMRSWPVMRAGAASRGLSSRR
jgi:hypothetical protein